MFKNLIHLASFILLLGFVLVGTANAVQWNIDFQGDDNHTGTYGQNGPRDYTEPGVYWNICEVQSLTAPFPGPSGYTPGPVSFELLDANGSNRGVTLTILNDSWGWANEGTLDDLWGDYLIILNTFGVDCDPTNWEITGLTPNSQCELTYVHRANIDGRGTNFVANGIQTTVVSTMEGYMGTALVMTDSSGKITGTADSEGFSEGCWSGLIISGTGEPFYKASFPSPTDGALHADTWITLSWIPGASAVSHDVYLGDNFEDVSNATRDSELFRSNETETFYVAGFPGFAYPEGLVPGTTYYWRIDEVNDVNPESPCKGDIWSFSIPPKTAYNPDPADGTGFVGPDNVTLSWTPGFGAILHTIYLGDDYDEVSNAAGGAPQSSATYKPGPLELEKIYYWRVDEFDAALTYKGDTWSFTTPGAVGNPQPAYGAVDVGMNAILNWTPSDSAASHELYFGKDKEVVHNADTGAPEFKGSIALGAESYDPGLLDAETTYYWRVDEIDAQGNTLKGPIWIFTTGAFLLIDDFEGYTDDDAAGEAIWQTWIDGFDIVNNGAQVGYLMPPYAEQTVVHSGSQSMPLAYTNDAGVTNSEASMTLTNPRDWTQAGVTELSLWFRGDSDNATEPLYVAISNSVGTPAIAVYDDAAVATGRRWTEWRIALQAFADQGINLANVDKIAIGLGSIGGAAAGGTGTVYIDDITLNRP